jgi:hypothetical protein
MFSFLSALRIIYFQFVDIQQRGYRSTTIRPTVGQRKKPKSDSSWFGFAAGEFSSKSGIGQILKRKSDETDAVRKISELF